MYYLAISYMYMVYLEHIYPQLFPETPFNMFLSNLPVMMNIFYSLFPTLYSPPLKKNQLGTISAACMHVVVGPPSGIQSIYCMLYHRRKWTLFLNSHHLCKHTSSLALWVPIFSMLEYWLDCSFDSCVQEILFCEFRV